MSIESKQWYTPIQNEKVVWYTHPSHLIYSFYIYHPLILGLVLYAVAGFYQLQWEVAGKDPVLFAAIILGSVTAYRLVWLYSIYYVITTRRIIKKTKIVGRDSTFISHRNIDRVDASVGILEALVSYARKGQIGSMTILSRQFGNEQIIFKYVPNVNEAERHLERLSGDLKG
jgi:hypothetical protein